MENFGCCLLYVWTWTVDTKYKTKSLQFAVKVELSWVESWDKGIKRENLNIEIRILGKIKLKALFWLISCIMWEYVYNVLSVVNI